MDRIYIFDVDGTLTPSRLRMTEEFAKFFDEWSSKNKYYLVTGSDLPKTEEQVPIAYLEKAEGIFTCCGNQFWRESNTKQWPMEWKLIYENKFEIPNTLLTYLGLQVRLSETPIMSTNHRENRGSMLNFSVVGRDCTLEERQQYFEWDKKVGERKKIAEEIMRGWPELDAVLGGQISIDIYPKGNDKSQILDIIKQERLVEPDEYIFIGDRTAKGGNDYPLALLMNGCGDCDWHHTKDWKQTKEILENLSD